MSANNTHCPRSIISRHKSGLIIHKIFLNLFSDEVVTNGAIAGVHSSSGEHATPYFHFLMMRRIVVLSHIAGQHGSFAG